MNHKEMLERIEKLRNPMSADEIVAADKLRDMLAENALKSVTTVVQNCHKCGNKLPSPVVVTALDVNPNEEELTEDSIPHVVCCLYN